MKEELEAPRTVLAETWHLHRGRRVKAVVALLVAIPCTIVLTSLENLADALLEAELSNKTAFAIRRWLWNK